MSDRHPSAPSRSGTGTGTMMGLAGPSGPGGPSRTSAAAGGSTSASGASSSNSVRRNLFQSQLTRRPTAGSGSGASSSSSNNSAETLRLDIHTTHTHHGAQHPQQQYQYQHHGGGHPRSNSASAPVPGAGAGAGARARSGTGAGSRSESPALASTSSTTIPGGGDIVIRDPNGEIYLQDPPTPPLDELEEINLDTRLESEKERQRLAEAVRQHQIDQNSVPIQPEELLEAVRASLRAKVAALAEDNWMYEREDPPRLQ